MVAEIGIFIVPMLNFHIKKLQKQIKGAKENKFVLSPISEDGNYGVIIINLV